MAIAYCDCWLFPWILSRWVPGGYPVSRGGNMARKITKALLDRIAIAEPGTRTLTFDSERAGFGVRATSNATTFFVQYRAGTGRTAPNAECPLDSTVR